LQKEDAEMLKEDTEDVPGKRRKLDEEQDEDGEVFQPTFRVSCKCSGSAARFFTPQVILSFANRNGFISRVIAAV